MALVWPFGRVAARGRWESFSRLMRAGFSPSRAEIVTRLETGNRQTPGRLVLIALLAPMIYLFSTLPTFLVTVWFIWLVTVHVCAFLLRRMVIQRPSRRDVAFLIGIRIFVCASWCIMPLVLEFRGQSEMLIGTIFLAAVLISAMTIAVETQVWIINLVLVGSALIAPEVVNLFHQAPQGSAWGVLVIKLLFLSNMATLAKYWNAGAKRELAMQAELDSQRKKAEELAAAKAMFLAHMSHEIRSPLAGVTLLASVLKRLEGVPEDQRQMIEQIDAGGQAILNLLNAVLDYSKIEAGKITLLPAPVNPTALLDSVTGFFALAARDANTNLSLSIDGVLPARLILDETRTRQVVTNLVGNAIKHSSGATVRLTSGYHDGDLLIEVVDTGKGVNAAMKAHLFAPHEQHKGSDSGAGLGLAISRGLVRLMAGEIGFRDTPGGGATFWFRIPAAVG